MHNIYLSYHLEAPIIAKKDSDKEKEAFLTAQIRGIKLFKLYSNEDFGTCLEVWEKFNKLLISQKNQNLN